MEPTAQEKNIETPAQVIPEVVSAVPVAAPAAGTAPRARTGGKDFKKNTRRGGPRREPKARPEFEHRIINIRRVARVVAGGRRFSFSVALVAGDRKGKVGVGLAKAGDTSLAIDKALRDAKKNMVKLNLTKTMSIPHDVKVKYASARILLTPAPDRGVIAGSSVRTVIELAGIRDINAKIISPTKNKLNNARAAILALQSLRAPRP